MRERCDKEDIVKCSVESKVVGIWAFAVQFFQLLCMFENILIMLRGRRQENRWDKWTWNINDEIPKSDFSKT